MNDDGLQSLVYVSSAVKELSAAEISHLLLRARERNMQYSVTGVLLYIGGNFMQCLEGPSASLDTIYGIIQSDPAHTGLIELIREPITEREFGSWSMGFQTREVQGYVSSPGSDGMFSMLVSPPGQNSSSASTLLQKFWEQHGVAGSR